MSIKDKVQKSKAVFDEAERLQTKKEESEKANKQQLCQQLNSHLEGQYGYLSSRKIDCQYDRDEHHIVLSSDGGKKFMAVTPILGAQKFKAIAKIKTKTKRGPLELESDDDFKSFPRTDLNLDGVEDAIAEFFYPELVG